MATDNYLKSAVAAGRVTPIEGQRAIARWPLLAVLATATFGCSHSPPLAPGEERVAADEPQIAADLIESIKAISLERHPSGVVERFNQAKSLACLNADFQVRAELPEALRRGLFAQPGRYRAAIRFASASTHDDEEKDFRGMSIKLYDVPGEPLWGEAGTQDFVLNSYPALFAATPREFLDFVEARRTNSLWRFFIKPQNFDSLWILMRGRQVISSPLDIRYWSTTPYRYGTDESVAVKYSAVPCSTIGTPKTKSAGPDHLTAAVRSHLQRAPACFDLMVQFQGDPRDMPIEDASVVWNETVEPFRKVARIVIDKQDFSSKQARAECEKTTFNPWQTLPEHRPLGGINRARLAVYAEIGRFRNAQNESR